MVLGSPGEENDAYTVLIGESDGQPSSLPPLPAGIDEADRPTTNAACPGWVHNLYLAAGPDGLLYEGWHPQIDTVYWCYFEHEHGGDPSMANYGAAFRYVADKNYGQNEQHEGFKGYVILNVEAETGKRYHWYVNIHSTTSAISRTCARQHTVVIAVVDAQTGELVAELGYKGDYGTVRSNQGDNTLIQPTFSATCPDQQSIDNELEGTGDSFVKRVRVANQTGVGNGRLRDLARRPQHHRGPELQRLLRHHPRHSRPHDQLRHLQLHRRHQHRLARNPAQHPLQPERIS